MAHQTIDQPNRLGREKSPYLLQHAANPVEWYPWGEEAFERARREDKPVFLSVGYSTCHWCHVMAHECFEDEEVARLMNQAFVCVKVDREERPDIDGVYMTVCQMMTGTGGWPLTIVMTPDKKPFFAATYIPKTARFGRVGMMELVPRIADLWYSRRDQALKAAEKITEFLRQAQEAGARQEVGEAHLDRTFGELAQGFDQANGGFGNAPKFPTPHNLLFLLRYWKRTGRASALQMATKTLEAMRGGGIYDHIGFGFHRYSTDARWVVPHFEKMLYDQALLTMAYVEAYQATGRGVFRETAGEVVTYVLRDMTSEAGGFYCAEDADSEGEEGEFYLWTADEVRQALGPCEADLFARHLNIRDGGNFASESTGAETGRNIPHRSESAGDLARRLGVPEDEIARRLESSRLILLARRDRRIRPLRDNKILTDWNGLMIAALAKAGQAFDERAHGQAAARAADFVLAHLRRRDRGLLHRYCGGVAEIDGQLNDYAFLVWGLIELYEASADARYLRAAVELNDHMLEHFWDVQGGLYFTPGYGERVLVRMKEAHDGAVPSGNSVAALNLLRLGRATGNPRLEDRAMAIIRAFSSDIAAAPSAHSFTAIALDFAIGRTCEAVIAGDGDSEDARAMLRAARAAFLPDKVLLFRPNGEDGREVAALAPFTRDLVSIGGKATAYVCRNQTCALPTTDVGSMLRMLGVG